MFYMAQNRLWLHTQVKHHDAIEIAEDTFKNELCDCVEFSLNADRIAWVFPLNSSVKLTLPLIDYLNDMQERLQHAFESEELSYLDEIEITIYTKIIEG